MYSKCLSVFITLITLLNNVKSEAGNSIYNIPVNDGLINYDGTHPSENFNISLSKKSLKEYKDEDYRLPRTVIPFLYDVSIFLKKDFAFRGLTKINATIENKTDEIVLHHGNLEIERITITLNDREVKSNDSYNKVTEKLTIKLEETLEKNAEILIAIDYTGKVKDNLIGFYRSSYFNEKDELTYLFATQFQAIHARHAFPCFDEPSFKAKFKLKVRKNAKYECLSNMPVKSRSDGSSGTTDVFFEESVPMSTYLVAFVISDFLSKGTQEFRVWARKEVIDQGEYGLNIGKKSLSFFEKTFNQKYQIEKMDMVAVPDFSAGATENWGLILYREAAMLYHKDESSDVAQQRVAATIVHECTHIWFGNLVTPEWWGVLWLSEGFARYYEYMATAKIETTWSMDQQFLVLQYQVALSVDGLNSSAPLTRNVASQSEIGQSGDTITYSKGASILRMMEMSFGSQIFNDGLTNYLAWRKYENAKPEHLWTRIQKEIDSKNFALKASIETIMNSWTKQAGFPVVSVSINGGKATLKQNRFLLRNPESAVTSSIWWIPISWTTKSNPDFSKTITSQWIVGNETIDVELKEDDWIVFNIKSAGFYRLNYDKNLWYRIIDTLNNKTRIEEIDVLNRAAIIDDLMNLARADYLDYNVALDGLKYLMEEMHYLPYKAAINALDYLTKRFSGQKEYDLYVKFILKIINKTHRKLSYDDKEGENRLAILLRRELNEMACRFNEERCIEKSLKYFHNWRSGTLKVIPKNRKLTIYTTAMKNANETEWDVLWNRYVKSNVPSEQLEILTALGCIQNSNILERYLLWAVSNYEDHRIRKQDSNTVYNAVSSCSLFGAELIIDFIDTHYKEVIDYNGGSVDSISTILSTASKHFSTQELIDKFEKLINSHKKDFKSIIPSLESQLKLAKYELEWYKKHWQTIVDWIKKFNEKNDTSATTDYFLPDEVVPTKYYIHLTPYIKEGNFTFDGSVEIETTVKDLTDKIVLHAFNIKSDSINIFVNEKLVEIKSLKYSQLYQLWTITLFDDLLEGTLLKIKIDYLGVLSNEMKGFYRSSYRDDEGKRRWLATTHLEPVGARRMFPCFDEPAMKAIFVISVTRPKSYHAISNMPLESTINVTDNLEKDTFQPTPRMSTYLVALVVSQFENQANKEYKVWARPNAISQANYSLSLMTPLIKFFETKLDLKYQLPKMDMVAVPDFSSGAMENWGLLTLNEKRMLYDPQESSIREKQTTCLIIAHEIIHQWFGDLVTPQWWKYLWLNEGFARYLQYPGGDDVHKSWKLLPQFVVDHLQTSFDTDGVSTSHAITHDVYNPLQISSRFNAISYAKAASIVRMTEQILGSKIFFQSLHKYLEARQYDVATPEDLYKAFQAQVDAEKLPLEVDVKTFLDSWTLKAGFPVVSVKVSGEKFTFSQERYLIRNDQNYPINQTWWVPITWTTQTEKDFKNTVPKYWLSEASSEISIKKGTNDWIIFNIQEAGYYRVNYDSDNWLRIIDTLKSSEFGTIHEINRAALIDDLFNLGRTGYVTYDKVLSATQYLEHETNYLPWKAAFNGLSYLNKRFAGRDIYDNYRTHILTIIKPTLEKLGMTEVNGEDHYNTLLRMLVIDWACKFELPECISHAQKLFAEWKNGTRKVPVNQRKTVYCTVIKHGTDRDWEFLVQQYSKTNFVSEWTLILRALSCSKNPEILNILLAEAITPNSDIRFQDSQLVFTFVYQASLKGLETVLEFIKKNYSSMKKYYVQEKPIKTILTGISQRLSTKELLEKMQDLLSIEEDSSPIKISLKSYLTRAHYELIWYDKYTPKIWEWLETTYPPKDFRLPKIIEPHTYNIHLRPYFEDKNLTFEGDVKISMWILQNTSRIILQSNELTIHEIKVLNNSGNELNYYSFAMNKNTHRLSIYLTTTVGAGNKIEVSFKYSGALNDLMEGFYRSSYADKNGKTRWLATTHFQPTHARKAFPCFDEPAFKAKFTVQIERPNDYHSRSNMPLNSTVKLNDERSLDVFEESPLMSSYLVAFVISDFESLSENKNFSIWARPNAIETAKHSLTAATKLLKILENITGIDYCLPKMDLVAVPDFKIGAMENWGLVTFREYGLLYDDGITQASSKRYINTTIAHEFVHMWFGNLVTCDWWDYTWLNEGFAQYFSYVSTNAMEPSWNLMEQFVVYELHKGMLVDASEKSHPMNNNVSSPKEISSGFDHIAYKKGASVIRMMYHSFGSKVFNNAIQVYLKNHQFKTTKPEHLWQSIQAQTDKENLCCHMNVTIQMMMDSWTSQPGYPLLNVTVISGKMILTQEQFLLSKNNSLPTNRIYWIPITYTRESKPNFRDTSPIIWFGNRSIVLDVGMKNEWFVLNLQQVGFYRVNYDVKSWYRLIHLLNSDKFKTIHVLNRAQIMNDVLNFAQIGYVNYTLALDATAYVNREDNHLPWMALLNKFSDFRTRFQGHRINELFALHVQNIVKKIYEKLGFEDVKGESQLNELNRELILNWACYYHHEDCVKKSKDLFSKWRKDPKKQISPNARPAVYCTALEDGTYEDWQFLWNEYLNTNFASEKVVILNALSCTKNKTTLNSYLQLTLDSNKIRRQDTGFAFISAYNSGKVGLETCLQFLIKNYNSIYVFFGDWDEVANLFSNLAASISTSEQIQELEKFIKNNSAKLRKILPALQSAVTTAKRNQQWFNSYSPEIYAWLERSLENSDNETTSNPGWTSPKVTTEIIPDVSSPLPPAPGGAAEDGISIHWIIALIFLLILSSGVIYKLCS